jgi:uncharacterized repeat protein (TIGR02543 family)
MLNNGTEAVWTTKSVTAPATTVTDFPGAPSRSGYNFVSWKTQADGSGSEFTASTTVSADITVYAQWTEAPSGPSYTVTFMLNNGMEAVWITKTVTAPATTVTDFPDDPAWSGYVFMSWNTATNGSGTAFTTVVTVNASITVYAKWGAYLYMVTFNNDGGNTEANPATKTVADPTTTIDALPDPPAKTGYTFGGWYTARGGWGTAFTASTTVSASITVYAKWDTYLYTVTLNKNGGDTEADPTTKAVISPEAAVGVLPVPPARTDYAFTGWNTAANGSGSEFTETTTVSGNITVYAQWVYSWTVTFNIDGGDMAADPATKTVTGPATTINALPAPSSKIGYIFGGWYTLPIGGGSAFTASNTVSASITVYAKWDTYSYTVTFNNNGGNTAANPAAKTVASPRATIDALPVPPGRTDYNFVNWNTASDGSGTPFTAWTPVSSGNITVYAQWAYKQFDITLNLDAGDGVFSQGTFTLSKSGTGSRTISVTGTGYNSPRWIVDGTLKGTGTKHYHPCGGLQRRGPQSGPSDKQRRRFLVKGNFVYRYRLTMKNEE